MAVGVDYGQQLQQDESRYTDAGDGNPESEGGHGEGEEGGKLQKGMTSRQLGRML
jgi:hypothetical protein